MAGEEALLMSSLVLILAIFFAKEKEFRSADAINVSPDAEDATECCYPGNSTPQQHTSP